MITILYNTETNKPISGYLHGGYTVDGKPQAVELPIVELEVITTARPEILDTQNISSEWVADLELNQYRLGWTVIDKTEEEIAYDTATADWIHKEFILRIVAPVQLIMDDIGIKMFGWFQINNMPVVKANDFQVHLYCNHILPEHQAIIDNLQGVIIIEEIPMALRPSKPYPSWEWVNGIWTSPIPYPEEGEWVWDEDTLSWVTPPEPIIEDII